MCDAVMHYVIDFNLLEEIENQLNVYLKLFVIMYADDTVIMSETKEDLQKQLNVFSEYCKYWQLKVNVEKNKIFVFSREASK